MRQGKLNSALEKLCQDLESRSIEYMLIGAVALIAHGYARFTEDIDLVLTREGLGKFHNELIGLGYRPAYDGARKNFRMTQENVPIEIIVAGEYPGDGKPKPVAFPEPHSASIKIEGIHVVTLDKLIELKLASGMTAGDRLKDLADVQELIKARGLGREIAERLDPFVRDEYLRLYEAVESAKGNEPERW